MLVQNGVEGDSRVQKEAQHAAAAGWEVVLLGRSPDTEPRMWRLGEAEVRLVPMRRGLARRRHELRSHWLRDPIAYPLGPMEIYRQRQLEARRAEIDLMKAREVIATRRQSPVAARLRRAALLPRRVTVRLAGDWADLRARRTERLRRRRKELNAPLDHLSMAFWKIVMGDRAWRRLDPGLWDFELAFGPVIDQLKPDLIHANDFQMLGVGAREAVRARAKGRPVKLVWDVHEYLPGMKPWVNHPWWKPAQIAHENEYAPWADAVVTVSEPLADLLVERHRLTERPTVVMNAPDLSESPGEDEEIPDLRGLCGIGPDTPLMVYSGVPLVQRGLHIMVDALPAVANLHAALVVSHHNWSYVRGLVAQAERLGVADRLHVLPHVPHRQIVPFIAAADIGVSPNHHHQNHEISLNTKFFDYSHARLPLVVSDVKTIAETVRETGQGEVFRAGDTEDFVRAVKTVLSDPGHYRAAYERPGLVDEWTWEKQSAHLHSLYRKVLGEKGR
ncbi:glycosyltransferase family 4 protein [Glycomyces buryatensis]|uniref:Glycosyltransferase family 4 protein n=2 Tax=Glycomyces buryatensis TaxID=2570927 RepID=A0A4S8PVA2_9ACTN|nr:glycosyltransferase family 4 protein [Glycomyces buryatensis]